MKLSNLTQQRLREVLHYDLGTGVFTWRINAKHGRVKRGDIAGCLDRGGYVRITVDGAMYRAHRLAWLYMTGKWPSADIDHEHGVRHDNRWRHLRDVAKRINSENRRSAMRGSLTGMLGVTLHLSGRFQASIKSNGKNKYLGLFSTPEEAHAIYVVAKRALHAGCTL